MAGKSSATQTNLLCMLFRIYTRDAPPIKRSDKGCEQSVQCLNIGRIVAQIFLDKRPKAGYQINNAINGKKDTRC
jgi:hypothetical protein